MQTICQIRNPALPAGLDDRLPRHRAVLQRAGSCVLSVVYQCLVAQYGTHTTKTLHYLAGYLDQLNTTKVIFTTSQTSKAIDSIAHACMKDLKMQFQATHGIKD
jgi:hypothetical protein